MLVVAQNLLAHLVERRLDTGAVVGREDLESRLLDRVVDGLKVDTKVSNGRAGERGRGDRDGVGAVDGSGEDAVVDGCGEHRDQRCRAESSPVN